VFNVLRARAHRRRGPGSSTLVTKISFTAPEVGQHLNRTAADTLRRFRWTGGKSPNIVFADADLDAALKGATLALYRQGRVCAAGPPCWWKSHL